ncbi:MAG: hypothetical protein WC471_03705 [Candidatus Woesearchaeota archaeon]
MKKRMVFDVVNKKGRLIARKENYTDAVETKTRLENESKTIAAQLNAEAFARRQDEINAVKGALPELAKSLADMPVDNVEPDTFRVQSVLVIR